MKIEKQVVSLDLAKKLKELGVKQDSVFYWSEKMLGGYIITEIKGDFCFSAFTVAELGEMLKPSKTFQSLDVKGAWCCWRTETVTHARTEANARGKMLIYLLEHKLLKTS